jgi:hypothetical protein
MTSNWCIVVGRREAAILPKEIPKDEVNVYFGVEEQ